MVCMKHQAEVDNMRSCDDHKRYDDECRACWHADAYYQNERYYWWGDTGEPPCAEADSRRRAF